MGKRKFTDEQEQEVCRRYVEGESSVQIGAELLCSPETIANVIRRNGLVPRTGKTCHMGRTGGQNRLNLLGQRFGRLVVKASGKRRGSRTTWICSCDCGQMAEVTTGALRQGTQSCGCFQIESIAARNRIDISGQRFGALVAVERTRTGKGCAGWRCQCDCGSEAVFETGTLTSGNSKSCGCLRFGGDDSIANLLDGSFRKRDSWGELYVYRLANHPELLKVGLDSTGHRADAEYGEKLLSIEALRVERWAIEQAVLWETRNRWHCPDRLRRWTGFTELRRMSAYELSKVVAYMQNQLLELGLWSFLAQFVHMTAVQRSICQQRAMEEGVSTQERAG